MGQRSQIYVRLNGELIVANYYQWNYGERMISRARSILEYCTNATPYTLKKKLKRYCDVNFDYRDIVTSYDIFEDYLKYGENCNKQEYFYNQDNNDGQLFIDITGEATFIENIKYAFIEGENIKYIDAENLDSFLPAPSSAAEYMKYYGTDYLTPEAKAFTADNLTEIKKYKLMTAAELKDFMTSEITVPGEYPEF